MRGFSVAERVLGITDPTNIGQSMEQAHQTLTGHPYDPSDVAVGFPPPGSEKFWLAGSRSQDFLELSTSIADIQGLLTNGTPRAASTFTAWSIYSDLMRQYGTRGTGRERALMIGSYSLLSSRAFVCLAQEVYKAKTPIVVDVVTGRQKPRHGVFVQGDGLALPFADESMHFVHTNQLIHMLSDGTNPWSSRKARMRKLVAEISRVMAPGGQLFMQELVPDSNGLDTDTAIRERDRLGGFVANALARHGIGRIRADAAKPIVRKTYLLDGRTDEAFSNYPRQLSSTGFTVYAQKPPRREPIAL